MMMSGLYLAAEVLGASAVVSVISCSSVLVLTAEVSSVFVITVSAALTLKGLLGTLTPPQVTASVCLTAELGVYEQEYTLSPLLFIFTSMGTPSASWENKSSQSWVSPVQIGLRRSYLLLTLDRTCAVILSGPFPASLASTVNSAGLFMIQPDFCSPGPYALTCTQAHV